MYLKKGDKVYYHPIIGGDHTGQVYECRTDSYMSDSGYPVVFLKGKSGYVCVEAVSRVEDLNYYVQVVQWDDDGHEVTKEMGPFNERKANKIEDAVNIKLNHEEYYTRVVLKAE